MRKKKYVILYFVFLLLCMVVKGEEVVIDKNPRSDVQRIVAPKVYKDRAELRLKVTKIKTEEIPIYVDKDRKKLSVILKNVNNKNIEIVEDISDLNDKQIRKIKNRMMVKNFSTKKYSFKSEEDRTRVEVNYDELPEKLFVTVRDKNSGLEKIYRGRITELQTKTNRVNIKLWLFGKEIGNYTNIVLNPSKNNSGNIEIRKQGRYNYPEDAVEEKDLKTVFDMRGALEIFDFEESDYIEIENIGGVATTSISNIINRGGNFYTDRNEYAQCNIPGYELKTRIWSESPKLELSLKRTNDKDGYVKFKILHKNIDGGIRQEIEVEMFINNKTFNSYIPTLSVCSLPRTNADLRYGEVWEAGYAWIEVGCEEKIEVKNLVIDSLEVKKYNSIRIKQYWGENSEEERYHNNQTMDMKVYNNFTFNEGKLSGEIYRAVSKIRVDWIYPKNYTTQYFEYPKLYLSYGNNKRKIDVVVVLAVASLPLKYSFVTEGRLEGLPITNQENGILKKNAKNGKDTIISIDKGEDRFEVSTRWDLEPFYYKVNDIKYSSYDYPIDKPPMIEGVQLRGVYGRTRADNHDYYSFYIEKMKLSKYERNIRISGVIRHIERENRIIIPGFKAESLVDFSASSIEQNIVRYVDVSEKFVNSTDNFFINLGTVYFKNYDDITILKQNASSSPVIKLPTGAYLEDRNGNKIYVKLSFERENTETVMELKDYYNYSPKNVGGNGKTIYMRFDAENYKKLLKNGGGKEYTLKNGDITVGINLDINPFGNGITDGEILDKIISNVKVITNEVNPIVATIKFNENTPLLKDELFKVIRNRIGYTKVDKSFYNGTLALLGNVTEYNYTAGKHNFELMEENGNIIKGLVTDSGSGGYWQNLTIGLGNKVTISQGKDENTYIALNKWNYRKSCGEISIKHYISNSSLVNQYYKFIFEIPEFNPYTYYNEERSSIKKLDTITVEYSTKNTVNGKAIIKLGEVFTQDYDMKIIKDERDNEGLKIKAQSNEIELLEAGTENKTGYKAKLLLKSSDGVFVQKIIGRDKKGEVYLELPLNLPQNKDFIIKARYSNGELFSDDNYLLEIGREGFYKELVKGIKIKNKIPTGKATVVITEDYNLGDEVVLKETTNPLIEKISFEREVLGINLESTEGDGIVKLEATDVLELKSTDVENDSFNENIKVGEFQELHLKNGNKIKILFDVDNKIKFYFTKIVVDVNQEYSFQINIFNSDKKVKKGSYNFIIKYPQSFLKIETIKDIDFQKVLIGGAGYKGDGLVQIKTNAKITKENLLVDTERDEITLQLKDSIEEKKLNSRIVGKNISFLEKNLDNENVYNYKLLGELNVPLETEVGNYTGNVKVVVSIRE